MRHGIVRQSVPAAWKHEAPRIGEPLLARERLVAKIEQALGKDRSSGDVLLVSAPAGYGKTTLLAQWEAATELPVMWYHLDAGDDDPATFIYGFVRALRTKLPRGRWGVKSFLANIHGGALTPADVRRAAALLAADIREHVARPMALVLTGVADLNPEGGARMALDTLLARSPDHLRLVLEFREVPSLPVSPLLLQRRIGGIGLEDLQLTAGELEALLERIGVPADSAYLADLHQLSNGWITGVLLATGALWPTCLAARACENLNREAVFSYLASEVIDRLPQVLRTFATYAAVLSYMTAPLCEALLNVPNARQLLAAIEQRTGFVTHVGQRPQEPVYRFQPLLRQALLDRLERRCEDPNQMRELRVRAGRLLEEQGDYEEAVQQYAAAAEYDALVAVIETRCGPLQRSGRGETLARWIDLLPGTVRERHPHLHVLLAQLQRFAGRTAEAFEVIQAACERILPRSGDTPALAARALTVRADLYYTQGQYEKGREDCERALVLAPDEADEVFVQAHFTLAVCLNSLYGPDIAHASLGDVEARCKRLGDQWALARLYYIRSCLALAQGAYRDAERDASAALRYAEEAHDEIRAMMCLLNLGGTRQYLGQVACARADLEAALAHAEALGHIQGQAYAVTNLADLELTAGRDVRAQELYERGLQLEEHLNDQHLRACIHAGLGDALTLQGQPERAIAYLAPILATMPDEDRSPDWALVATALAFACHQNGELVRAADLLNRVCAYAWSHGQRAEFARAQLTQAAVLVAQGQRAEAAAALRDALDISAQVDGSPRLLLDARHLPSLWPLLRELDHPVATSLLSALAAEQQPEPPPLAVANTRDESIRVYALGTPRVMVGDVEVPTRARPQLCELLVYLLDRDEPLRGETIVSAIWPERDQKAADDEFRRARSELKKALGRSWLERREGRWHLAIQAWIDTRELERLADDGERLAREGYIAEAADTFSRALDLWKGPFFEEAYNDWATLRREDLQQHYLNLLERLAELELDLRHYDTCADHYTRLLEAEPYRESAHRGLMTCYAMRGDPAMAIAQYNRCVAILHDEIGVTPGPQTMALCRAIRMNRVPGTRAAYAASGS